MTTSIETWVPASFNVSRAESELRDRGVDVDSGSPEATATLAPFDANFAKLVIAGDRAKAGILEEVSRLFAVAGPTIPTPVDPDPLATEADIDTVTGTITTVAQAKDLLNLYGKIIIGQGRVRRSQIGL